MDPDNQTYLTAGKWCLGDERFHELFFNMVEWHWLEHLDELGIRLVGFGSDEVDSFGNPIRKERVITGPRQL